jgi:hypothetical protein
MRDAVELYTDRRRNFSVMLVAARTGDFLDRVQQSGWVSSSS